MWDTLCFNSSTMMNFPCAGTSRLMDFIIQVRPVKEWVNHITTSEWLLLSKAKVFLRKIFDTLDGWLFKRKPFWEIFNALKVMLKVKVEIPPAWTFWTHKPKVISWSCQCQTTNRKKSDRTLSGRSKIRHRLNTREEISTKSEEESPLAVRITNH